jgi:hypothetical protein
VGSKGIYYVPTVVVEHRWMDDQVIPLSRWERRRGLKARTRRVLKTTSQPANSQHEAVTSILALPVPWNWRIVTTFHAIPEGELRVPPPPEPTKVHRLRPEDRRVLES